MTKSKQELYKNRPTSPHLSIYKPQISSVLSVFHRVTGVALFFSMSFFTWWFILWTFSKFDSIYLECTNYIIFKIFAFATSLAGFYHLFTGVRHLMWDCGKGLSIKSVNFTGLLAIFMTFIATIIFWFGII